MSKRVHEIAKELGLNSKEVIGRLNEAGIEVNHHSATIEDPDFERVFGDGAGSTNGASNGRATSAPETAATETATVTEAPQPAAAPADSQQSAPQAGAGGRRGGGKKRRRVVIDASATNRGPRSAAPRQTSAPAPAREEPRREADGAIRVEPGASVQDLAEALAIPPAQIIKVLMGLGEMKTMTQTLSIEEIELIADELDRKVEIGAVEEPAPEEVAPDDDPADLVEKPPVVTVMGHVDHGKTSLLDRIRKANVQSGEAGGITQHIGAYQVNVSTDEGHQRSVTFIDTPGHEAFTEMRARGAKVTDVVVLVVAADDGIMPQTQEAIEHARAAEVPLIVALNKIDVPNANPDRVLGQLSEQGLVPEVYGGETVTVPVSAKTGEGIEDLLENIVVVAELEDLKANPNAPASGYVIEGERDPGRGPVATLLLSRGTLHKGDVVLAGTAYGRVRAMLDYTGSRVQDAGPGDPAEILGLSGVPEAGTRFEVVERERIARDRAQQAATALQRQELAEGGSRRTLEELLGQGGMQDLNLVIKADVAGSVEALKEALAKLSTDEVRVNIVRSGVGALTDSDVMLGSASDGILLGFNVRPTNTAKQVAEREGVEIRTYDVIYKALEEIEAAMRGMLAPDTEERETGTAEVRQIFRVPNAGVVAGCYVTSGEISRTNRVRVVRDGTVVYEGNIGSLRRFKDDVRAVRQGFECGISVENFNDLKEGDVLEFFETVEIPR
jgi:translation initiation factor IF-2